MNDAQMIEAQRYAAALVLERDEARADAERLRAVMTTARAMALGALEMPSSQYASALRDIDFSLAAAMNEKQH